MRKIKTDLIESLRLDAGIEKTAFCRSNGIGIHTYNRLLKDSGARVKDATILKIAKALDIEPSALLNFS